MNRPIYAFYGHHKCATMSLNTLSGAVCKRIGRNFSVVYNEDQFSRNLDKYCQDNNVDFLAYGNADINFVRNLPYHRAFHIIRDPRDIVVSAYYSHGYSHSTTSDWPELVEHRKKLQSLSPDEGITEEIRFRRRSFEHMYNWDYEQDGILEIRFEDFAANSYDTILRAFTHLGLVDGSDYRFFKRFGALAREIRAAFTAATNIMVPRFIPNPTIPSAELLALAWRNRFEAKSQGRKQGAEDIANHYRKGKSGDWKTHMNPDHKVLFKELYPDLVPKLGYAESDNW